MIEETLVEFIITRTKRVYFAAEFRIAAGISSSPTGEGKEITFDQRDHSDIVGFYNENTNTGSFGFYAKNGSIVCNTKKGIRISYTEDGER